MTCSAHLPETLMLESILAERRATRKDPESDQLPAKQDEHPDNLKLTPSPKAWGCEPGGRAMLLGSHALLLWA